MDISLSLTNPKAINLAKIAECVEEESGFDTADLKTVSNLLSDMIDILTADDEEEVSTTDIERVMKQINEACELGIANLAEAAED